MVAQEILDLLGLGSSPSPGAIWKLSCHFSGSFFVTKIILDRNPTIQYDVYTTNERRFPWKSVIAGALNGRLTI